MKKRKLFNSILLLPISPIFLSLCFWWSSISFIQEEYIKYLALGGFVLGILIDILIYKKYINKDLSNTLIILAYLFYTVCVLGFFMGVPVFNIFVCIPFALYITQYNPKWLRTFNVFSSSVIFAICCASAYLALKSTSTIHDLEGMFNLHGILNMNILYIIIIVGGIGLIAFNYLLTKYSRTIFTKIVKHS